MLFYDSDDDACMLSHFSRVRLFETPWTVACQALLSMGFSRQEYWSGFPCPPPRGSSPPRDWTHVSCISCIAGRCLTTEPPGKPNDDDIWLAFYASKSMTPESSQSDTHTYTHTHRNQPALFVKIKSLHLTQKLHVGTRRQMT